MTRVTPVVLSVCGDPGGASALAPVLEQLRHEARVELSSYAYRQGLEVLHHRGLPCEAIEEHVRASWFGDRLRELQPALVLAATSCNGLDHEKQFIAAAKSLGIASLALLDFWSNYRERFADHDGELRVLPDRVAVMDEAARSAMQACGFPAHSLVVTGQPALDRLAARRAAFTPADRADERRRSGIESGEFAVLFASQPLRELYGHDAATHLGYDEHAVLRLVVDTLSELSGNIGRRLVVVVRPHPRERMDAGAVIGKEAVRVVVRPSGDQYSAAMAADLVLGMTSVLLVEARYLGCPVLSLQPGASSPVFVGTDVAGIVPVLTRQADIPAALAAAIRGEGLAARRLAAAISQPAAADKVVQCVYSMIGIGNER